MGFTGAMLQNLGRFKNFVDQKNVPFFSYLFFDDFSSFGGGRVKCRVAKIEENLCKDLFKTFQNLSVDPRNSFSCKRSVPRKFFFLPPSDQKRKFFF